MLFDKLVEFPLESQGPIAREGVYDNMEVLMLILRGKDGFQNDRGHRFRAL
jgi:hypothetical protein